jgi:hypothetical protein
MGNPARRTKERRTRLSILQPLYATSVKIVVYTERRYFHKMLSLQL